MLKLLLIVLVHVNIVLMCRWVCIDENNNIKKHFFNQSKFVVEFPHHDIDLTEFQKRENKKLPGELSFSILHLNV